MCDTDLLESFGEAAYNSVPGQRLAVLAVSSSPEVLEDADLIASFPGEGGEWAEREWRGGSVMLGGHKAWAFVWTGLWQGTELWPPTCLPHFELLG